MDPNMHARNDILIIFHLFITATTAGKSKNRKFCGFPSVRMIPQRHDLCDELVYLVRLLDLDAVCGVKMLFSFKEFLGSKKLWFLDPNYLNLAGNFLFLAADAVPQGGAECTKSALAISFIV